MKKTLTLLIMLAMMLSNGLLWAQTTISIPSSTELTSYTSTVDGITLTIQPGSKSTFNTNNNGNSRGIRLYQDGTTFTITTPTNKVVTGVEFVSGRNGNFASESKPGQTMNGGFTITGNNDWSPFVGKAESYTWTNENNTTAPITFTTKNTYSSDTEYGNVYINSLKISTVEVQPEDVETFVTLRNNPVFITTKRSGTLLWNVAVRMNSVSGNIITALHSTNDMEFTISNTNVATFNRVTSNSNSGFNLVFNLVGGGETDVTVKFKGGTYGDVTYAASETTFKLKVTDTEALGTYRVDEYIDYSIFSSLIPSGLNFYDGWTTEPSKGTYEFTSAGYTTGGTLITEVPGIFMTIGAANDDGWAIVDNTNGSYASNLTRIVAHNGNTASSDFTSGCFYKFEPIVNGYLTLNVRTDGYPILTDNGNVIFNPNWNLDGRNSYSFENPLLAGHTYYFYTASGHAILNSFSFRPAFLAPDAYTTEQSKTQNFNATYATTAYPQIATAAHPNIEPWARHEVANVSATGVTLVGTGWTIVGTNAVQPLNNTRKLTAVYPLNVSVLDLVSTNPENNEVLEGAINNGVVEDNVIKFFFSENISITSDAKITMFVNDEEVDVTNHAAVEGSNHKQLNISVDTRYDISGATYTFIIDKGSISMSSNDAVRNSEIKLVFSRYKEGEPIVVMTEPSNLTSANVGTPIVLQLSLHNSNSTPDVQRNVVVIGYLKAEGEEGEGMRIQAYGYKNYYIFKPTGLLQTNTNYIFTVEGNQMILDSGNGIPVTTNKRFTFTTGGAAGDPPVLVSTTPFDGYNGNVDGDIDVFNGSITFTFNESVTVLPYTSFYVTPVNGSESPIVGSNYDPSKKYEMSADNKTITLSYSRNRNAKIPLKYDVTYEIEIPANSVYGPSGMPNENLKSYFRVQKNSNAREITLDYMDGKPFTWDFNKFGIHTDSYENMMTAFEAGGSNSGWQINDNKYGHYNKANDNYLFPSGEELFIKGYTNNDVTHEKYYFPEFQGIRISVANETSINRPQIQKYNSSTLTGGYLDMTGNTHYVTIPSVPANTLVYIGATPHRVPLLVKGESGANFSINSRNAEFVYNYMSEDDKSKGNYLTQEHKTYIVKMDENGGDLTFCCSDMEIDKIAISVDSKELIPYSSGVAYATDCQSYPVEYSLTKYFDQGEINGLYITTGVNGEINSSTTNVKSSIVQYAAGVERNDGTPQGTIVMATAPNNDGEYVFPYFTTDVNTWVDELANTQYEDAANAAIMQTNCLVGVINEMDGYKTLDREVEGNSNKINYVFTATRYITDQSGNLSYMEPKHLKKWDGKAPKEKDGKYFIYDTDENEYEVVLDNEKYYLVDEQGNKKLRTVSYSNPTFQPVLINNLASGDPNLSDASLWQLPNHSSYLVLDLVQNNVNSNILLDGIVGEELDGIETIAVNNGVRMETDGWYTLYGVKLAGTPTEKGIYIYNNKKVLIK